MSLYLTSRDKSSNWWRDKIFVAFHWTFVIIQHYPFLKKYKYFKTNIENKSFWCNKLHSLPRIFSLLKRKGLHPKNNRNINVEQSLEEKRRNVNLCSKLDVINVFIIISNIIKLDFIIISRTKCVCFIDFSMFWKLPICFQTSGFICIVL